MTAKRRLATAAAVLFLLLLLAALGARFWAADRIIAMAGPTHIAADDSQVVLFAAGRLFRLSADGELLGEVSLDSTGLQDDPVDLRFLHDGSLLVAGQRPAVVRQCNTVIRDCRPLVLAAAGQVERQFKILPGRSAGVWFLTDARGDTLWREAPGAPPEALLPPGTLAAPNDLAFDADDALWVADTDHRRIVELAPAETGGYAVAREHAAANAFLTGPAWYPVMLARGAAGRWWVIQAAEYSDAQAELLIYDPDHGAEARVGVPAGAYPTDLAASGGSVLVTDMDRFDVYRVDGGSLAVAPFGDAQFRARLGNLRARHAGLERLSLGLLAAVIVCGVLAVLSAVLATPAEKRWTRAPAPFDWAGAADAAPHTSGIHWLERDPAFDRTLQWSERLAYILLPLPAVVGLAVFLAAYAQLGPEVPADVASQLRKLGLALLLGTALLALMIPLFRTSMQTLRMRLGTDGRQLYIRRHDGREFAADPARLAYTDRMIFYEDLRLPLAGGKQRLLYRPGEVETWLGPLLRKARKLSAREALQHQWRHRDRARTPLLILATALGAALLGLLTGL